LAASSPRTCLRHALRRRPCHARFSHGKDRRDPVLGAVPRARLRLAVAFTGSGRRCSASPRHACGMARSASRGACS